MAKRSISRKIAAKLGFGMPGATVQVRKLVIVIARKQRDGKGSCKQTRVHNATRDLVGSNTM